MSAATIRAFLDMEQDKKRLRYIRKLLTKNANKRKTLIVNLRDCLEKVEFEDIAEFEQYKKTPAVNTWFRERGLVIEEKFGAIAKEFGYADARQMFDL